MEDEEKIKKKLRKDFEDLIEENPGSDIPISEKRVRDKKIREI